MSEGVGKHSPTGPMHEVQGGRLLPGSMSMLLTLELVVFGFGAAVTLVTAIIKLLNRIAELHSLLMLVRADVEHIRQEQAEQAKEIHYVNQQLQSCPARPTIGPHSPH